MTKEEAKKRIEKLKKVINHHRYFYPVKSSQSEVFAEGEQFNGVYHVLT